ncbi:alpha beta hydrolase fold [Trichoderma arundinaceum]|uniref:Alpha beta hydrolase fold n=1 Tax=Trichoderma arundinaceum TaxID=490622 RepID=A0A395NC22_TRIAR|nr:alpha beta hydrolase fold [Trichoderma arundinaceum]
MASQLRSYGLFDGPRGSLFLEREGNPDGQSILFIHGLGGTTNAYQAIVPHLTKFDLVRFDWSGHGQSSTPQATNIDTYVDDCEAVIKHLGLQSVIVVGHSLGGLIALLLAAKLPQVVKSLVLLGPVLPPPEAGQKAMAARAETVRQGGMAAVADTVVSNAFASESLKKRTAEVALARELLTRQGPEGYALAVESLKNSYAPDWKRIKALTAVVSGDEDRVSSVAVGKTIVSNLGDLAEQVVLTGVGHWHMLEAPLKCVEIITKYGSR